MTGGWLIPLGLLASSFVPAILVFAMNREQHRARNLVNLAGATAKLLVVAIALGGVYHGHEYEVLLPFGADLVFLLRIDALSLLFVTLSALLWFVTTVYAIGYLKGDDEQRRFFGFFSLCVTATVGIALAGNLLTFFLFYELLTLSTLPLVVHSGDDKSLASGRTYLRYTLGGSAVLLFGIVWLESLAGPATFRAPAEAMAGLAATHPGTLTAIFVLLAGGLAVKGAMMPVHGWLPAAMVAPAPVSALLHAVAVVKAGAFGIVRVVFDVFGLALMAELSLGLMLACAASTTIILASVMALRQHELKPLLAYSTVSQVSYIMLGASLLTPLALVGCLVHLVHQGVMKVTLFFCAGALQKTLDIHRIDQLDGVGRRMPWTMLAFSTAALGMIGIPPIAGFVSKWYLGLGALEAGQDWVILVLGASTLLNAAYFLPLLYRAWFGAPDPAWTLVPVPKGAEASELLVWPAVFTALVSLAAGLLAAFALSPLGWATLIVARDYLPR